MLRLCGSKSLPSATFNSSPRLSLPPHAGLGFPSILSLSRCISFICVWHTPFLVFSLYEPFHCCTRPRDDLFFCSGHSPRKKNQKVKLKVHCMLLPFKGLVKSTEAKAWGRSSGSWFSSLFHFHANLSRDYTEEKKNQILAHRLCCVTSGKSLNLSASCFPHCSNRVLEKTMISDESITCTSKLQP